MDQNVLQRSNFVLFWIGLTLSMLGCKSFQDSSLDADAKDTVLGQKELDRVNGDWRENRLESPDAAAWQAFVDAPPPFNASTYEKNWNIYKEFVTPAGESFTIKQYKVRFHMHREVASETTPATETATSNLWQPALVATSADQNSASQSKVCTPNKTENYRTLSYQLLNFRQPNLARNFLVLSKLGFFDGKKLSFFRQFAGLIYAGSDNDTKDPYYYAPDIYYTDNNANTSSINDTNPVNPEGGISDLRGKSGADLQSSWEKFKARTALASLVGIAENVAGLGQTRRILGMKVGFAAYQTALVEHLSGLSQYQTYPVVFGRLIQSYRNQLDIELAAQEMDTTDPGAKKYDYIIDCVEILEPEVTHYAPLEEFPSEN